MTAKLLHSLLILPVPDLSKTADYYVDILGFRAVKYLEVKEPHICLYRDDVEIVLLQSKLEAIQPNRDLHGYGYDGYFTAEGVEAIYNEVKANNAKIVRPFTSTDYGNQEFVFEDIDGRWIAVGLKKATS